MSNVVSQPQPANPLQRSADRIARVTVEELAKMDGAAGREFMVQTIEWLRHQVSSHDEARRRLEHPAAPEAAPERKAVGACGKGTRSSDAIEL